MYSDFFKMIPEASLIAILIVLFVADFAPAKTDERKWFNPLASELLLLNTVVFGLQRAVKKQSSICSSFQHCSVCLP